MARKKTDKLSQNENNGANGSATKKRRKPITRGKNVAPSVPAQSEANLKKREAFLQLLYDGWTVTRAANIVGIDRTYVYNLRKLDPAFRKAWEDSIELGLKRRVDILEDTAWKRAIDGYEEVTKRGDKIIKTVVKVDNNLLVELLKAHAPEKYRNIKVEGKLGLDDQLMGLIQDVQNDKKSALESAVVGS